MSKEKSLSPSFYKKSFYVIRHGETDWNKNGWYQGHNDIPLNETGQKQAEELAQSLVKKDVLIDAIISSPLKRANETAEILRQLCYPGLNIQYIDDLKECASEKSARYVLSAKGIEETDFPSFDRLQNTSETKEDFITRCEHGLNEVLKTQHKKPLIVAHGGVATAICIILNVPVIRTPNCCMLYFKYNLDENKYSLNILN